MNQALTKDGLTSNYTLTDEQIDSYRSKGHVLLRNVISRESVRHYREAIGQTARSQNKQSKPIEERSTYGKAFLQTTNLWETSDVVKEFVFAKRFAGIAANLLGVQNVRLYHDQSLFKEPGGGATPWHQDMHYWPLDTDKTITMWMPLVDISSETGMITFASGSHVHGLAGDLEISDKSEAILSEHVDSMGFAVVRADEMNAGDATFHNGYTIHSAPENVSPDKTREVMTVIYFPENTSVAEPRNNQQRMDLEAWFGGRKPGDRADSDMNPLL